MEPYVAKNTVKAVRSIAAAIALAPGLALAYQPLITDDTGTQGAGGNQSGDS